MKVSVPIIMMMLMVMSMLVILALTLHDDIKLCCAQIRPQDARDFQIISFDRQLLELRFQVIEIQTEVQERPNSHVATDAGKAVEVECLHTKAKC